MIYSFQNLSDTFWLVPGPVSFTNEMPLVFAISVLFHFMCFESLPINFVIPLFSYKSVEKAT
jgi:hypothetical protein